jgi:hypothetical protein
VKEIVRKRLGHVPDWLTIGELRLVLDVFYGAFDAESAQTTMVAQPWDQRRYPQRVTVAELCTWLVVEIDRVRHSVSLTEANTDRQGPFGSDARRGQGAA